jgi:hypothetical protein
MKSKKQTKCMGVWRYAPTNNKIINPKNLKKYETQRNPRPY